jgi:mRNA interferase RelE/StbE
MAEYVITFAKSARRELEALEAPIAGRIFSRIENLSENPRPRDCLKLHGRQGLWRLRVGDYRVIYAIDDKNLVVDIAVVRHRRDVYR